MDQQNNTAAFNDVAGVLPMDTGAIVNGIHDEGENNQPSSKNAGQKKGRGRPPKSAGSTKASSVASDTPKRARGRPAKTTEVATPIKQVAAPPKKKEEVPINDDANKKKRGRPSKGTTPTVQTNGISKPQVQPAPVINHQEQKHVEEPAKKKRGRPSGGSPKKAVVIAPPAIKEVAPAIREPSPATKKDVSPARKEEASPIKKRGRPSGSAAGKKPAPKPKVTTSGDGSARKRGRPKKAAGSPTGGVAAASITSATEPTNAIPNNVQ